VEYALGDSYPGSNTLNELYYLGPLSYVEKVNDNTFRDLINNKQLNKAEFQNIQEFIKSKKKNNVSGESPTAGSNTVSSSVSPQGITNYDYDFISGVPDYQQNDNDSMANDCVPTAAANIIMYWDSNGYPNMVETNNWINVANRLGVLMNHTDENGVYSSAIAPGLNSYFSEHEQTDFSATWDYTPTFSEIDGQIESGNPALLRTLGYGYTDPEKPNMGHVTTIVGTESYQIIEQGFKWYYYLIVHDNWETTGENVYLLWDGQYGSITDYWKITR